MYSIPTGVSLSVVIPTRNEEIVIGDLLDQLSRQTLDPSRYEILVIDGRSEDRTVEIVRTFMPDMPNLRVIDNPGYISSKARNIGVANSRSPYVLFVDGHCQILDHKMLAEVVSAFSRGEVCISRPQPQISCGVTCFQNAVALARNSILGHYAGSKIYRNEDSHCSPISAGCGYMIDLYRDLGGVDETFDACEDLEFNFRLDDLGIAAYHSEKFSVGYFPRRTLLGLFRQLFRYGYGRARLARKPKGTISPLVTTLAGLVVFFLVVPVVCLALGLAILPWVAVIGFYLFCVGIFAGVIAFRYGFSVWLRTWICFAAIHFGGGLGYLSGMVNGPSLCHTPQMSGLMSIFSNLFNLALVGAFCRAETKRPKTPD